MAKMVVRSSTVRAVVRAGTVSRRTTRWEAYIEIEPLTLVVCWSDSTRGPWAVVQILHEERGEKVDVSGALYPSLFLTAALREAMADMRNADARSGRGWAWHHVWGTGTIHLSVDDTAHTYHHTACGMTTTTVGRMGGRVAAHKRDKRPNRCTKCGKIESAIKIEGRANPPGLAT